MTTRPAAPRGAPRESSLTGQVRRLDRAVLATLGTTTAVSGLVLLLLVALQVPQTDRYGDGTRAVRLAHRAMLDQQTGLRAFLATGQGRFLQAYRQGREALPRHDAAALRAFEGQPAQVELLRETQRRQRAWVDQWALEALGGVPEGTTPTSFVGRDKALFDAYRAAQQDAERAADRLRDRSQEREVRLLLSGLLLELGLLAGAAALLHRRFRRLRADVVALAPVRSDEVPAAPQPSLPPAPPPLPEVPLVSTTPEDAVDASVLQELTGRLGDRAAAFTVTLLQTWRTETAARLAELDQAAAEGDRALAARVCHAVKSGSAALGAGRLARTCQELETRLRGEEQVDLADAAARVRAEVAAADAAFPPAG